MRSSILIFSLLAIAGIVTAAPAPAGPPPEQVHPDLVGTDIQGNGNPRRGPWRYHPPADVQGERSQDAAQHRENGVHANGHLRALNQGEPSRTVANGHLHGGEPSHRALDPHAQQNDDYRPPPLPIGPRNRDVAPSAPPRHANENGAAAAALSDDEDEGGHRIYAPVPRRVYGRYANLGGNGAHGPPRPSAGGSQ